MSVHKDAALLVEQVTKKCAAEFPHDPWNVVIKKTDRYISHHPGLVVRLEIRVLLRRAERVWVFTKDDSPKPDLEKVFAKIKTEVDPTRRIVK